MHFKEENMLEMTQSNILTTKGAEISFAGAFFPHIEDSYEMSIIAHLKNKYDVLGSRFGYSPNEKEILETLSFTEEEIENSCGDEPIVGRTLGIIYKKPNYSLRMPHSKEDDEKLEELKKDYPEFFLSLIRVKEYYRDYGVGSAMLKFAEYKFAKELYGEHKKRGFIEGHFFPLDETKMIETEKFYRKNGFEFYDREIFKPIITEKVLDETAHIFER